MAISPAQQWVKFALRRAKQGKAGVGLNTRSFDDEKKCDSKKWAERQGRRALYLSRPTISKASQARRPINEAKIIVRSNHVEH